MASAPARPPRYGIDNAMEHATADANSTASHGSSSRYTPAAGTRSTGTPAPAPIALADVLARSNADHVAALDQVLAERNQFCLDNAKLSSENVRIWNLMGRIRKENENLKARCAELERAYGVAPSANKGSPLSSATNPTPSSPAGNRRRLPYGAEAERSSSPLSSPRHGRQNSRSDLEQRLASSGQANPAAGASRNPQESANPSFGTAAAQHENAPARSNTNGSNLAYDSPITSVDQGPSHSTNPVDTGADRSVNNGPQASIMQQRAAAQAHAQSMSLVRPGQGPDELADSLASHESGDFEAIDRSSASGTDESPHQMGMTPHTPGQDKLRTPHQQSYSSPSGIPASPYQPTVDRAAEQERSLLASGPNRNRAEVTPTMIPSTASTRSLVSKVVSEDRISRGSGSRRSKDKKRVLAPRLDSSLLRVASVKIQGTNYRSPDRGKESISFLITVDILHPPASWGLNSMASGEPTPPTSWTIEKSYSDIIGLDAKIRSKVGKKASQRLAPLPDKALFKDHAPAKVDQRKALLEIYLQSLMVLELPDKDEVCTFLCTDVVPNRLRDPLSCSKEGFLTKKGQNLGRWVTRFYVLRNSYLSYFETRGGAQIGTINIREAQIGRQQKSTASSEQDENAYRHAFLILEKRDGSHEEPPHIARHVLCAESDEERDDWVDVLVRAIAELDGHSVDDLPSSPTQAMSKMSLSQNPSTPGRDGLGYNSRLPDATFSPSADNSSRNFGGDMDRGASIGQDSSRNPSARMNSIDSTATGKPTVSTAATSLPQSASYRSFNEPRSPVSTRNADLQDPPGSPGLRNNEALGRGKASISGPINGAPIPAGYKFGARDEAAPDNKKDDKKRFWQGFRAFGGHDKHNREPRPVFGVPLAESIAISSTHEGLALPSVVYRCIEYLEKRNAFMEEGIYRLSGSSAVIKTLKDRFNMEGDVDLLAENQYYDPHAIAGLLKTFLRELPTSVLTRELHMDFMRINELQDRVERVNELGHLVSQLPLANYSLLRTLCSHLIKIIEHSDVNKMTMRNVGIVFSPTLAIGAGIFALFLTEFDSVFETDANGEPAPKRIEEEVAAVDPLDQGNDGSMENSKRNKRNSVQYRESQAEKLLGLEGRSLSHRPVDEDLEGIADEAGAESWAENNNHMSERHDSNGQIHYEQHPHHQNEGQQQMHAPSAIMG
ncbi:related to BEM3 - GTPase-activating protein [Ustilago trichophora]|uniref:Related to BEM3 - GTPase-activating protein n=1 Tax=Ustilago trichophora TaxID=86804 RepID=A0A5C3DY68_9BASI|nr:related to BEM3 - GTPase-activating protein [Ustilago trichophora]